jgi:hypothetical protein
VWSDGLAVGALVGVGVVVAALADELDTSLGDGSLDERGSAAGAASL